MPNVSASIDIRGPRERVYAMAKDMESFPRFMPNVTRVTVLERKEAETVTEWDTRLQGRPFRWVERDQFDDERCHISYSLVKGDLRKFEGEWITEEIPGGTRLTLTVEFEFGLPMVAAMLNPIARLAVKDNCTKMLAAIKRAVEDGPEQN